MGPNRWSERRRVDTFRTVRRTWGLGITGLTLAPMAVAVALAPHGSSPSGPVLAWLLIFGYTGHVLSLIHI